MAIKRLTILKYTGIILILAQCCLYLLHPDYYMLPRTQRSVVYSIGYFAGKNICFLIGFGLFICSVNGLQKPSKH